MVRRPISRGGARVLVMTNVFCVWKKSFVKQQINTGGVLITSFRELLVEKYMLVISKAVCA